MSESSSAGAGSVVLLADLGQASRTLPQIAKRLESDFLRAGDAIAEICETGTALVSASDRLSTLAIGGAGGESAMMAATDVLREPLGFLTSSGLRTRHVIDLLADYHERLRRTLAREKESRRILAPLTYVQSLLRIESSRLDADVARVLVDLVKDIERLQVHVEEVFGEKFIALRETHVALGTLVCDLTGQAQAHEATAASRTAEINVAVAALEAALFENTRREISLTAISRDIHDATGRLVMALQFQDIVAQKLEHVHETCEDMHRRDADLRSSDDTTRATAARFVEAAGRVVLSQLDAAQAEILSAEQAVDEAIHRIAAQMHHLEEACVDMKGVDVVSAGADGMVQVMLEALSQVSGLLVDGTSHVASASRIVAPISAVAADVSDRLRTLAHGMHLVGLNAEIQAARVPDAGGLEVLAATTSGIARETRGVSAEVAADVDALVDALGRASTILASLEADGTAHAERLDRDRVAVEARLHAFRDETLSGLAAVGAVSTTLQSQVAQVLERPRFEEQFTVGLDAFRRGMERITTTAGEEAERTGITVDTTAITREIRARYTMASERRIHDAAIVGQTASARKEVRGGSVELFEDESPAAGSDSCIATATPNTELWNSDTVELF